MSNTVSVKWVASFIAAQRGESCFALSSAPPKSNHFNLLFVTPSRKQTFHRNILQFFNDWFLYPFACMCGTALQHSRKEKCCRNRFLKYAAHPCSRARIPTRTGRGRCVKTTSSNRPLREPTFLSSPGSLTSLGPGVGGPADQSSGVFQGPSMEGAICCHGRGTPRGSRDSSRREWCRP